MLKRLIWLQLHKNSGMSLMENLVAIVIIALMVVVTTPPLIMATAARIQNRRAETAINLAQKELERIRLIIDTGTYTDGMLPPVGRNSSNVLIGNTTSIATARAPNQIISTPACIAAGTNCSQTDNQAWWSDASQEYFIQTFRTTGVSQSGQVVVFRMGIRVYSKVSAADLANLRTESAPLYLNSSTGQRVTIRSGSSNITAKHSQFPLAVVYVDFSRGDLVNSLERYHDFIGN